MKKGAIVRFEDLEVWQAARQLCKLVQEHTKTEHFGRDFNLVNQIKRSSGSCMDNIAEGFGREGRKEFVQFLSIAKGSLSETKSQYYRAFDYNYLSESQLKDGLDQCDTVGKLLSGFIRYLKTSEWKGYKYKK